MTTVADITGDVEPRADEQPVFVSDSGGRARVLRLVGAALAALTAVWLLALLAGSTGVVRFPGLPLPSVGGSDTSGGARDAAAPRPAAPKSRASRAAVPAVPARHRGATGQKPASTTNPPRASAPVTHHSPSGRSHAPSTRAPASRQTQGTPTPASTPAPNENIPAPQGRGKPAYTPSGNVVPTGRGPSGSGSTGSQVSHGSGATGAQGPRPH